MSLRSPKVGIVKSGLKNLNGGGIKNYCTKPIPVDEALAIVVDIPKRPVNEIFPKKFPFPGGIGLSSATIDRVNFKPERQGRFKTLSQKTTPNGAFRQQITEIVENIENHMRIKANAEHESEAPMKVEVFKADRAMELKAVQCPKTIKKDIGRLFVDVDFRKENFKDLTVLNLTQKSATDMSAWSEEMEAERDLLTKDFINVATAICTDLQKLNYWADFIEPSSGRPYLGGYTNASLFETDDRYRDLGFKIEDLGCCKIIKHAKWATNAFVGTIFTNAPIDSADIEMILELSQAGHYFEEKPKNLDLESLIQKLKQTPTSE